MSLAMFYCITKPKERDTLKMETTESDSPGCQASEDLKRAAGRGVGIGIYKSICSTSFSFLIASVF